MKKINVFGIGAGLGYLIGKYNLIDVLVEAAVIIQRHREIENAKIVDVFGDSI